MIVSDIIFEDGAYWVFIDKKKGFAVCHENGVCADIIGYASDFEGAKNIIKLHKSKEGAKK